MLDKLEAVEKDLPSLFRSAKWSSLDVDYEPPRVERLWTQYGQVRVYLHRIHPCPSALFHPHPWPSAVRIVSGKYEMGVGYGTTNEPPPLAAKAVLTAGSSYEMVEPNGWHYVRPIGGPSMSIMVTGQPWGRWSPGKSKSLKPLAEIDATNLLRDFEEAWTETKIKIGVSELRKLLNESDFNKNRVQELIERCNEYLNETRAQREQMKDLRSRLNDGPES